jgi:hypothetical protein
MADAVGEGEYRCCYSYYFECTTALIPSRAYYFESWPVGMAEPVMLVVHIHYWDKPGPDEPGKPKHVNMRRAWRIDLDGLRRRAEGHEASPVPRPPGIDTKGNTERWDELTGPLLWDPNKDPAAEGVRAGVALQTLLDDNDFCPAEGLWGEVDGACITGGSTADKMSMNRPGWDFAEGKEYVAHHLIITRGCFHRTVALSRLCEQHFFLLSLLHFARRCFTHLIMLFSYTPQTRQPQVPRVP